MSQHVGLGMGIGFRSHKR